MKHLNKALAIAALSAFALAGCGTAARSTASPVISSAAPVRSASPSASAPSADVKVCQDYAKQRAWITANGATLTPEDIATMGGWLDQDAASSTGRLHADVASESAGFQRANSSLTPTASEKGAAGRISADCTALGVDVGQAAKL